MEGSSPTVLPPFANLPSIYLLYLKLLTIAHKAEFRCVTLEILPRERATGRRIKCTTRAFLSRPSNPDLSICGKSPDWAQNRNLRNQKGEEVNVKPLACFRA